MRSSERCARCGRGVEGGEGFRLTGPRDGERAAFCRLEHVVAWVIRGAPWDPAGALARPPVEHSPPACSECGAHVADPPLLLLVRHRGGHLIADAFCSLEHLRAWAVAGGRWRSGA